MKQTLYTLFLLASVGTIGLVATNPKLVQQGAVLVGLNKPDTESARTTQDDEDHLSKFLKQYPDNPYSASVPTSPSPGPVPERPAPAIAASTSGEPPLSGPAIAAPAIVPPVKTPPPVPVEPVVSPPPPQPKPEPQLGEPTVVAMPVDTGVTHPDSLGGPPPVDPFLNDVPGTASTAPQIDEPNMGVARSSQIPSNDYRTTGPIAVLPIPTTPAPWPSAETSSSQEQDLRPPVAEPVGGGIWAYPPPPPPPPTPFPQPGPALNGDVFSSNSQQLLTNSANAGITDPGSVGPAPVAVRPEPRTESQFQISPSVVVEEVPCYGTEMVARVGTRVILMCDILTQLRRHANRIVAEQMKNIPLEQREQIPETEKEEFVRQIITSNYPALLQEQIMLMLVYNDFVAARKKEDIESLEKKMGEDFDQNDVPRMMKEFNAKNIGELKQYLQTQLGSSLEQERRLNIQAKIAQQWMMFSIKDAEGECTYDEMMEYYTKNHAEFERQAKVRWMELFALIDQPGDEKKAWDKIAWMGNQVAAGTPFEKIAGEHSDGFTASKGGLWDWTQPGSLTSEEIEQAIFTMPPNRLSPVIKGPKGYHIVMVVEREEASVIPLLDAQVTIREKIKMQRRQRYHDEYFAELKRKYPTIVLRETIDFNPNHRVATENSGLR